jgi:hypothetical protein
MIQLETLAERDSRAPEVWPTLARVAYEKNDLPAAAKSFARAAALRDEGRTWFRASPRSVSGLTQPARASAAGSCSLHIFQ